MSFYRILSAALLTLVVALSPCEAQSHNSEALQRLQQAQSLRQKGQRIEAGYCLRRAIRLDPSFTSARLELIDLYLEAGAHNLAFAAISEGMKAETRKAGSDLTPFMQLMQRVDMNQVEPSAAASETARLEQADQAIERDAMVGQAPVDPPVLQAAGPQQSPPAPAAGGPRMGRYYIMSYGSPYQPPIRLGYFVLLADGTYRASNTEKEDYHGEGQYRYDQVSSSILWLSGPFKRNEWGGGFSVTREGLTHRIELTRTTLGFNDLD